MTELEPAVSLRRAALICNARSRRGREWYPAVRSKLLAERFDLVVSEDVADPRRVRPLVDQAVRDKVPLIIVGGGDGTLSGVAAALKGSSSVLAVLPLGTGNAFARDLRIPFDVEGSCRVVLEGTPRETDLGIANGKHFVNVATVGLTALIVEELTDEGKRRFGRFVYALAIMRALARVEPFVAKLTIADSGDVLEFPTLQMVVGSGRFHAGPFPVTPGAQITDHLLNGYALKGTGRAGLLKVALRLLGGGHVSLPAVEEFSFRSARLETDRPRRVVIDGEVHGRTPLDLAIDPGAIRVMVGKS